MNELVCNLHIHSTYSDGTGNYSQIAEQAIASNIDVAIITDHNIHVRGIEKYYHKDEKCVLILTGEEVHDPNRNPQKNHALVIGCEEEVASLAPHSQELINRVRSAGGAVFLAHPYENDLPLFNETDISWVNWEVEGFTGIELWNSFSEFKTVVRNFSHALFYAFFPELIPHQPLQQTLAKWDELLSNGQKIFAVGGADSHALHFKKGLIQKTIFPYHYHFSTINNHLLLPHPLTGDLVEDKRAIYNALFSGSSFIGNDLPASTRGFSFTAESDQVSVGMGEELKLAPGATIRVSLPQPGLLRLIHNGTAIQNLQNSDRLLCTITEPGAYRVEAYIKYFNQYRGWIFSNPIFFHADRKYRQK